MRLPLDLSNGGLAHAEISQFSARQPLFGRPNITGGFTLDVVSVGRFGIADVQGSFTASAPYDILFDPGASQGKQYTRAEFSAASSNAIYSGSSVQPPALLLLPCIKV